MAKKMKLLSLLAVLVLMMGIVASCGGESGDADNGIKGAATAEDPWQCGATDSDSVIAYIDGRTLWVSGEGNMADFEVPGDRPWDKFAADIDNVFIDSELTNIGKNAFYGIGSNTEGADVFIGAQLVSIGESAFESFNFADYSMPTLPESLKEIGSKAFANSGLVEMYLDGKPDKISDNAFSGDTVTVHVRDNQGWKQADMKDFGGELTYKILYALKYTGVYEGGDVTNEGVEYHDAGEEFEYIAEEEEGYVFDHFEVVSGNIKIKDPKNSVLTTKLTEDVEIKCFYKKG